MNENLKEAAGMGAWHVGADRGRRVVITCGNRTPL